MGKKDRERKRRKRAREESTVRASGEPAADDTPAQKKLKSDGDIAEKDNAKKVHDMNDTLINGGEQGQQQGGMNKTKKKKKKKKKKKNEGSKNNAKNAECDNGENAVDDNGDMDVEVNISINNNNNDSAALVNKKKKSKEKNKNNSKDNTTITINSNTSNSNTINSKTINSKTINSNTSNSNTSNGNGVSISESQKDSDSSFHHPFTTHPDDHCETPLDAYRHIEPILSYIAKELGVSNSELRIYDPYFCDGAVIRNLSSLGFTSVRNVNTDCYAEQAAGTVPEFDVIVTNPPYSSEPFDHVESLLRYAAGSGKPFFLLMPNYCYRKDYYKEILRISGCTKVFFLVPEKRYSYLTPSPLRSGRSGDAKTSPFVSFWYASMGRSMGSQSRSLTHDAAYAYFSRAGRQIFASMGVVLAPNEFKLPQNALDSWDPRRKRPRKKQREAAKRRAAEAAAAKK